VAHQAPGSRHVALDRGAVLGDVTDVEGERLVLAQPGAQGQREEDMIAKAAGVLARDLEQLGLLEFGHGAVRTVMDGVVRHACSPSWLLRLPASTLQWQLTVKRELR
jgi:hypothetical protein